MSWEKQNQWRNKIKKQLENYESNMYKIKVINPNDYFNYFANLHKTQRQMKEFFMYTIEKSNLIIVNLNNSNSSVGTAQELEHARMSGIPIIGFGTENVYPWESEVDCQVVFDTLEDCVEYAKNYFLD